MSLGNANLHQRGEIPEIEKLANNRIRVIRRFQKFTREDVDNENLGSLMGDFGALDTTDEQISGQGYTDCRLISVEVDSRFNALSNADNAVLVKTYETLTESFVEITDPLVEFADNGLKKITKVYRAVSGTTSSNTVGVSTLSTGEILASSKIEDNTALAELTEIYLEEGTLSESIEEVGSQKAITKETIGSDPSIPTGYSIASKDESNFEGYQTNRFRFLKNNVVLSESEDKVGSQLSIVQEVFNGTPTTPDGYVIAREEESDVDGIPTKRFTFLKENVILSETEDKVGSQLAISQEVFKGTPVTPSGYSIASEQESNVEGIPTRQFRFLKNNVVLSESEDKVGSQLAQVKEVFNGTPETPSGYTLADSQASNVDGIPTRRFRFLKSNVVLSESEDKVGSQLAIVKEVFNGTPDTPAGYSVANEQESNVDGIPTKRVTFLKDNVILSETQDKVGSQLSITQEVFNGTPNTPSGYSIANERTSDVDGVPTKRFTFLKNSVVLSESEDNVGSQKAIVQEVFNGTPSTPTGYSLASNQKSDVDGIPTQRITFLKNDTVLSRSEDKVGSQLAITIESFNPTGEPTESGYSVARTDISDFAGIPTKRFTLLKDNVVLSESEDKIGSQLAIVKEVFNGTPDTPDGYSEADNQISNVDGVPTRRFRFLKNDVVLSESEDKIGSQLAVVKEVFNSATDRTPSGYTTADERKSNVDGITTTRFRFLKSDVTLSETQDKVGSQLAIVKEMFDGTPDTPSGYAIANEQESDVDGIPTKRFTFLKEDVVLSQSEDKVGSQLAIVKEVFKGTPDTPSGYVVANEQVSNVDGIPTRRFTFLKQDALLSESKSLVGSQLAIVREVFDGTPDTPSGYVTAREEESNVDGIKTRRFTFLKENVVLSKSENTQRGNDTSKFLTREVQEIFKPSGTPTSSISGVLVGEEESDVGGIPTKRFTFVKGDGEIIKDEKPAMAQLVGCKEVTITTLGSEFPADPTGTVIAKRETENNGYKTFQVTAIQGTITGVKQEYKDVVEVTTAGTVELTTVDGSAGSISGSIAVANVTPPRQKTIAATVKVEIMETPPDTADLAYDLSEISCSVTSIQMSENFRGADVFETASGNTRFSGERKSASMSARIQTYPNSYLSSGTSSSGSFEYVSSYENTSTSPNTINAQAQDSITTTKTFGTGSTSDASVSTTGILKRNSRPLFTDFDGTTYYEVITWSV